MITTMAAYPAALQDLPPLGQTGLTDASMNDNNNNNNNRILRTEYIGGGEKKKQMCENLTERRSNQTKKK